MIQAKNSACLVSLGDLGANEAGTGQKIDTPLTYQDSRSVHTGPVCKGCGIEFYYDYIPERHDDSGYCWICFGEMEALCAQARG